MTRAGQYTSCRLWWWPDRVYSQDHVPQRVAFWMVAGLRGGWRMDTLSAHAVSIMQTANGSARNLKSHRRVSDEGTGTEKSRAKGLRILQSSIVSMWVRGDLHSCNGHYAVRQAVCS